MNPPKVIVNAEPPKEWFEIVGRGLERHNTAATSIVEYYPVCFVVREAGNHVRGGLYGSLWGQWMHVGSMWVDRALRPLPRSAFGLAWLPRALARSGLSSRARLSSLVRLLYFSAGVIAALGIWAGFYFAQTDPRYALVELDGPVPYATLQFSSVSDCQLVRKNAELCLPSPIHEPKPA